MIKVIYSNDVNICGSNPNQIKGKMMKTLILTLLTLSIFSCGTLDYKFKVPLDNNAYNLAIRWLAVYHNYNDRNNCELVYCDKEKGIILSRVAMLINKQLVTFDMLISIDDDDKVKVKYMNTSTNADDNKSFFDKMTKSLKNNIK